MSTRRPSPSQIVEALIDAYRRGYFPMAQGPSPFIPGGRSRIHWFSPDPRGVLPLTEEHGLHVPRRLRDRMRQRPFTIRIDSDFESVMRGCAMPRATSEDDEGERGTWIDDTLVEWYLLLHRAGHAHSIEAWSRGTDTVEEVLVGGVYGVSLGAAFFGESMFHLPRPRRANGARDPLDGTDAGKICLITLVRPLARAGYTVFDTQMVTSHVARFGGAEIPRREYLRRLDAAVASPDLWPSVRI